MTNLQPLSDKELLEFRMLIDGEMRKRGMSFSVGEIGEQIALSHFNDTPGLSTLAPAPKGTKNVDAISRSGDRYSIKTLWRAKKTGTVYPDVAQPDKQLFEYLIIVLLAQDYSLKAIYRFSWSQFISARSWDSRMNAWYISSSARALNIGEKVA